MLGKLTIGNKIYKLKFTNYKSKYNMYHIMLNLNNMLKHESLCREDLKEHF